MTAGQERELIVTTVNAWPDSFGLDIKINPSLFSRNRGLSLIILLIYGVLKSGMPFDAEYVTKHAKSA